ncbi:MAG: Asp23/Gls24 family envelope stress response protein [Dorea sp.]|nr:Asp23/Gls24 family envelope stress response protein [Dorea sp.]
MSKEEKNTYTIKGEETIGEVKLADEVVSSIAGLAALEVDGVSALAGNAGKFTRKNASKGVKIEVLNGVVTVALSLILTYGYNIKSVTMKVQEKVKFAIENMTGLEVADVNINVVGVDVPEEE